MRTSFLKDALATQGAVFRCRFDVEVVAHLADREQEYRAIRDAVGLSDFSYARTYRVPEEKGMDFLDDLLAGNVAKIRFGRVLHTLLANDDGHILADCYVANNDQEFVMVCEPICSDAELDDLLKQAGAADAGLQDLTADHVVLSLDGFKAWEVAKEIFGADVLGLPYLSIEVYPFGDASVQLIRAGKTSEFGYLLIAPHAVATELYDTLRKAVEARDGRICGVDIHDDLRLEGRFFNIYAEGIRVRDPLVLGLQWMIDFDKPKFAGRDAILKRREEGLTRKIIGLAADSVGEPIDTGTPVFHDGQQVAEIVASMYSHTLKGALGLGVFPTEVAYSGLSFQLGSPTGAPIRSVSMPPILPKSLGVKLDEM